MKLLINNTEYRMQSDFSFVEQAGATAVFSLKYDARDRIILSAYGFSETEAYGFSETEAYGFATGDTEAIVFPSPFDEVKITDDDGTVLFTGVIGIPSSPQYSTGFETRVFSLQVQSANTLLQRRTVNEAWQGKTTSFIVNELFTKYIADEGITLGGISTLTFEYEVYTSARLYIADILDELAAPVGATWHIDAQKRFWFQVKDDFTTVSAPEHITKLQKTVSSLDSRTVQIISGAKQQTSEQTETFTWVANQSSVTVNYPLVQTPTITINGSPVGVGVSGLDDTDASKIFLWSNESATIKLNSNATTKPSAGDTVVVTYFGYFFIEIEQLNTAKIAEIRATTGSSGRIERVSTDTSIESYTDGLAVANALLERYADADETVTCELTSLTNTDIMTVWTFNKPDFDIVGDYVIVKRTIKRLTDDLLRVTLELKNKNYWMKYGTVYADFDKAITSLSIRSDTVIVKPERTSVSDIDITSTIVGYGGDVIQYPTTGAYADPIILEEFYPTI